MSEKGRRLIFGINGHWAWQVVKNCPGKAGLGEMGSPETGKVRGVSRHRQRDAFAVMAAKADDSGDGLRLLQEHLGHQSFNTTAKYRKVAGEEHRQWFDRLWQQPSIWDLIADHTQTRKMMTINRMKTITSITYIKCIKLPYPFDTVIDSSFATTLDRTLARKPLRT